MAYLRIKLVFRFLWGESLLFDGCFHILVYIPGANRVSLEREWGGDLRQLIDSEPDQGAAGQDIFV
jgi:hypothetical protein